MCSRPFRDFNILDRPGGLVMFVLTANTLRLSGEKPENRLSAKMPLLRWVPEYATGLENAFLKALLTVTKF